MDAAQRLHGGAYQLSFRRLSSSEGGLSFPCDEFGRVDMDALGRAALNDYLFARAVVGGQFVAPVVEVANESRM